MLEPGANVVIGLVPTQPVLWLNESNFIRAAP